MTIRKVMLHVQSYKDGQFYFFDGWYWAMVGGGSGRAKITQYTKAQTLTKTPTEWRSIARGSGKCETFATGHRVCVIGQGGSGIYVQATISIAPPIYNITDVRNLKAVLHPAADEGDRKGVLIQFDILGKKGATGQIRIVWFSGAKGFEKFDVGARGGLAIGKNKLTNALPIGTHNICVGVV